MADTALRSSLMVALMCALGTAVEGQDRRDSQSLAQLQAGDRIRLSLKTGPVEGAFQNWTPQQVTAGTVTATKEDVLKIERYRANPPDATRTRVVGEIRFAAGCYR